MFVRFLKALARPIRFFAVLTSVIASMHGIAVPLSAQTPPATGGAQYTLMIWESPAQIRARTDAKAAAGYWKAFADFGVELQKAGILRGGTALRTGDEVRTVTVRGGQTNRASGPRARGGEELGGYFVIEVASIDEAVRWASRIPSALTGAVEVRPAYPAPTMMK